MRCKLFAIEEHPTSVLRAVRGEDCRQARPVEVRGVHFEEADEIMIEGESSNVILDGETFRAETRPPDPPQPAQPLSFVKLAA